jgi:hypothetical protein
MKIQFTVMLAMIKFYSDASVRAPLSKNTEKYKKKLQIDLEKTWDRLAIRTKLEHEDFTSFFMDFPMKLVRGCGSFSFLKFLRETFENYENKILIDELNLVEEEMKSKTQIKLTGKIRTKAGNELLHSSTTIIQKKHSLSLQEDANDTPDTRDTLASGKSKSESLWGPISKEGRKIN